MLKERPNWKALDYLDLSHSMVTSWSIKWLLKKIQDQEIRLCGLDLSHTPLCSQGFYHLSEIIKASPDLQFLYLQRTRMTREDYRTIQELVLQHSSLVSVGVGGNPIGDCTNRSQELAMARTLSANRIEQRAILVAGFSATFCADIVNLILDFVDPLCPLKQPAFRLRAYSV